MTTRRFFQLSSLVPPTAVAAGLWAIHRMDSPPQSITMAFIYGWFGLILGLVPYAFVLFFLFAFLANRGPRAYIRGALLTPILCAALLSPVAAYLAYTFNESQLQVAARSALQAFFVISAIGYIWVLAFVALHAVLARSGHIRDPREGAA